MNKLLLLNFILLTSLNASLVEHLDQKLEKKPDKLRMLNQIKKTKKILSTLSQTLKKLAPNCPERTALEEKKADIEKKFYNYVKLCNDHLKNTTSLDKEEEEEEIESGSDEEYEIDSSSTSEEEDYADLDGDRKEHCLPRKKLEPKKQEKPHLFPPEPKGPGTPGNHDDPLKKNIHWCTLKLVPLKATSPVKLSNSVLKKELTALFLQLPLKPLPCEEPSNIKRASLNSKSTFNLFEFLDEQDLELIKKRQAKWDAQERLEEGRGDQSEKNPDITVTL